MLFFIGNVKNQVDENIWVGEFVSNLLKKEQTDILVCSFYNYTLGHGMAPASNKFTNILTSIKYSSGTSSISEISKA